MEWLALRVRGSLACRCGARTPLAGIREVVACAGCGADLEVPAPFGERDPLLEAMVRGDGAPGSVGALDLARGPLTCPCGGALAWPEAGRYAKCAACGDALAVRWPDDVVRRWDARIACVVGDAGGAPRRVSAGACAACGASLAGPQRAQACAACGVANFLGDETWLRRHPDHAFTLVYQLDDRVIASARRFAAGAHPGLTDAEAAALVARLDAQQLDDALAGHGRIDLEMARVLMQRELTDAQRERIASWLTDEERAELGL